MKFPYFGQIAVRSPTVNNTKNVTITAENGTSEDLVVMWKVDWDQSYGEKKKIKTFNFFTPTLHL